MMLLEYRMGKVHFRLEVKLEQEVKVQIMIVSYLFRNIVYLLKLGTSVIDSDLIN